MKIIPAIDILNGSLVRLEKGNFTTSKVYSADPFKVAEEFSNYGFDQLHIVDLSGSRDGRVSTMELLSRIIYKLNLKVQFGGGIRKSEDAEELFNCGVDKIILGSISVTDKPEFENIIVNYGAAKIICAVDSQKEMLKVKGWTEETGISIYEHISYCKEMGINTFLCTDIERDGMLIGPNFNLYEKLNKKFPDIQIIASGGVSSINDLIKLNSSGIYGVVTGKAIYENKINLKELAELAR
jgi:phosphoribosylformimino-5-aminoimidazole carboxamide ribotide isomerase